MSISKIKDTVINVVYVAGVSAIVSVLINHYEATTGKSLLDILKKDKGEKAND